mgnify:CR=1 FL=1
MADILMPKATAVWLLDNTSLTFAQIADFCGLHHLEVKGIADGDVAENMRGVDPIAGGMLSREDIRQGEEDENHRLKMAESKIAHIPQPKRKGSRYTPVIRRQDKPDAVAWFIRNHPEVSDAQISKLIGTTKSTINNVRDKSHWNSQNIRPVDPVTLGLCTQIELDEVISKSAEKRRKIEAEKARNTDGPGLAPAQDDAAAYDTPAEEETSGAEPSADDIFKNFS